MQTSNKLSRKIFCSANRLVRFLAAFSLLAEFGTFTSSAFAQDGNPEADLFNMNLQEIIDTPVSITSKTGRESARQAPGAITVLDAEFIKNSGAQDLGQLIELVPGFQFTTDNSSGSILAFRGLENDGRILLRIDGQDMPELLYQTSQLQSHYSTADIERVEIIRGPGSIAYGGSAEYAVIEVTTKRPNEVRNGEAVFNYGATSEGRTHITGTLWGGVSDAEDFLSVSLTGGEGVRGSDQFKDFYGNSFDMQDDAEYYPRMLNVGGQRGDWSFRYIMDRMHRENRDIYFINAPYDIRQEWNQDRAELRYRPKLSEEISGNFALNYTYDEPWNQSGDDTRNLEDLDPSSYGGSYGDLNVQRLAASSDFTYDPKDFYKVLLGFTIMNDEGRGIDRDGNPNPPYTNTTEALYSEVSLKPELVNINLGTRYEWTSDYDQSWVSRAALSKAENDWHSKLQFAQSFRSPGYANNLGFYDPTGANSKIEPETTDLLELEAGHRLWHDLYFTGTVFDVKTKDTITYYYDSVSNDSYANLGDTGSRGFEGILRYVTEQADVSLSYAYHRAENENETFGVIGTDGQVIDDSKFIGLSPHIATLIGTWKFTPRVILHSSLQFQSEKYANTSVNEDDVLVPERLQDRYMWRAAMTFRDVQWKGLDIQLGVNNILDEEIVFPQPYSVYSYHAVTPGLAREFFVNASFTW